MKIELPEDLMPSEAPMYSSFTCGVVKGDFKFNTEAVAFLPMPSGAPPGLLLPSSGAPPGLPMPWKLLADKKRSGTDDTICSTECGSEDTVSTMSSTHEGSEDKKELKIGTDDVDTLLLENLPCRCSQQEILDAMTVAGFGNLYDFFYMPVRCGRNFGYAIVGFKDKDVCAAFAQALSGFRFSERVSSKCCTVIPALVQGFSHNGTAKMWNTLRRHAAKGRSKQQKD